MAISKKISEYIEFSECHYISTFISTSSKRDTLSVHLAVHLPYQYRKYISVHISTSGHPALLPLLMTPLSWYHMLCKSTNHNTHTSSHLISPRHPFSCQDVVVANDAALLLCYHMLCKRCSTNHNTDAHTHTHTQRYENRQPFLRRDVITSVWWTFDLIPTRLKQWQAWWCSTKRRQILYMKQRGEIFSRLDRGTT